MKIIDFDEVCQDEETGKLALECREKDGIVIIQRYTLVADSMEEMQEIIKGLVAGNLEIISSL